MTLMSAWSNYLDKYKPIVGGVVASWLVRSTLEQAVWVRALARDIVLCSCSHGTSLHSGVQMGIGKFNAGGGGNLAMD